MPSNPLVEVFGFPAEDMSEAAVRARRTRLCPFGNPASLHCSKASATNPIGVCSVKQGDQIAIICPVRLRQHNIFIADAADFFFPGQRFVALTEVRLKDRYEKAAGNIDVVIAALDENEQIVDFGAIEVQAVYISGNISKAFHRYMEAPATNFDMEWPGKNYPKPDYLSSSRKHLLPQLMFKGRILHTWQKKIAVVVHSEFFKQLPPLQTVAPSESVLYTAMPLT